MHTFFVIKVDKKHRNIAHKLHTISLEIISNKNLYTKIIHKSCTQF